MKKFRIIDNKTKRESVCSLADLQEPDQEWIYAIDSFIKNEFPYPAQEPGESDDDYNDRTIEHFNDAECKFTEKLPDSWNSYSETATTSAGVVPRCEILEVIS